jgi:dephospho-CoA kinase
MERINAQWTDDQRAAKSNYVIDNTSAQLAQLEIDKILKILKN